MLSPLLQWMIGTTTKGVKVWKSEARIAAEYLLPSFSLDLEEFAVIEVEAKLVEGCIRRIVAGL